MGPSTLVPCMQTSVRTQTSVLCPHQPLPLLVSAVLSFEGVHCSDVRGAKQLHSSAALTSP